MSVTFSYNGKDLSDVLTVHDIRRSIGNSRTVIGDESVYLGMNLQEVRFAAKKIEVDFSFWSKDRNAVKHELAALFHTSEPKRLTFSDEPDKYYLALLIDDVAMSENYGRASEGTLTFLIPDGVAHSTTYRTVSSNTDATISSERMTFSIRNNGSVPAYPIVRVKHNAENGYIGLVNQESAFELGNREEADRETVRQSELLLDYRDNAVTTGLSRAQKNVGVGNDSSEKFVGTASTRTEFGRPHIYQSNRGAVTNGYNSAVSLTWDIPNDSTGAVGSLHDYLWWRQIFWLGKTTQYGFMKVTVSDTDGKFLYGVETYKRKQGMECEYNVLATNGKGSYNILKRWTFLGSHHVHQNPFHPYGGACDLKRNDDKLRVHWWGSYVNFTIPELKGKKSAKIHVILGAYGDRPLVHHMYLDSLYYRKDYVIFSRDIPNRYPTGSNVVINSEDDTVYIDGISKIDEVVDGSKWLALPPGESELEVYVSSFVKTKPSVTIEFEERWL